MISDPDPEPEADHLDTSLTWRFFSSLPTIITINTFQSSFFTAFAALKNKTKWNGQAADGSGRIVAFLTYTICPLIAFVLYGENIKSNLLLNIAKDKGVIPVILMFLFMIISALTIPIVFFVGKEAVLIMFDETTRGSYSGRKLKRSKVEKCKELESPARISMQHSNGPSSQRSQPNDENGASPEIEVRLSEIPQSEVVREDSKNETEQDEFIPNPKDYLHMKPIYYYIITLTLWLIITILSIVVGDVSVFFGVIGAIVGCYFMFTGPGLFYVIVTHKKKVGFPTAWSKIKYALAWIYLLVGLFLMTTL